MARLDSELVSRGIARSRERAKEMVKAGAVTVNGRTAKKASDEVTAEDVIESSEQEVYVGRGALKLEKAAQAFRLDFTGRVCLDIGASTGGFTEYMLMHGAARVYAVDVGHGQLAGERHASHMEGIAAPRDAARVVDVGLRRDVQPDEDTAEDVRAAQRGRLCRCACEAAV